MKKSGTIDGRIRLAFAATAAATVPSWLLFRPELLGLTTLVVVAWGAWELIHGSAQRRMIHSSTGYMLRASHVWHGEVMSDALVEEGKDVTLSATGAATFNIPDLGLPDDYAILRPGARGGYVLTLCQGMTGTFAMDGKRKDVATFLAESETATKFHGKTVGPGDWGVINLDGSGNHVLFFQFVANESIPSAVMKDSELILPALGFSVILHAIFLVIAFSFHLEDNSAVFPGRPELVADYLVRKPTQIEEQPEPIAGIDEGEEKADPTSTVGTEGKAGGEGEKERLRALDPDEGKPDEEIPKSIQKGLLTSESRRDITKVLNRGGFDKKLGASLARLQGAANDGGPGGFGTGTGFGVGEGEDGTGTLLKGGKGGPGGGGNALGDVVTQRAIKSGGTRPPKGIAGGGDLKEAEVKVSTGTATGSLGGLTAAQINKVVFSRKNAIKTCYQRELQRSQGLGGKIVIHWEINSAGAVTRANVSKTTMHNGRVEDCIVRQVLRMQFPKPKGGSKAVVNYPFVFAQQ